MGGIQEYFSALRKLNENHWKTLVLPVEIVDSPKAEPQHIETGHLFIKEAVERLEEGMKFAGFEIIHDTSMQSDLIMALKYMNPYGGWWAGYETKVTIKTREGKILLSDAMSSFAGKLRGAEIVDWLPALPVKLTAILHDDPQPLIDAMWGFRPGDPSVNIDPKSNEYAMSGGAAIALRDYPSPKVIENLLAISQDAVHIELRFRPTLGMFLKTEQGDRHIGGAEYTALMPTAGTQENAYYSIIVILGRTRDKNLTNIVLGNKDWIAHWKSRLLRDLNNIWFEAAQGIAWLLGELRDASASETLKKCIENEKNAPLHELAKEALAKLSTAGQGS